MIVDAGTDVEGREFNVGGARRQSSRNTESIDVNGWRRLHGIKVAIT